MWVSGSPALPLDRIFLPVTELGHPVKAGVSGEIIASWHPEYAVGGKVFSYLYWAEHALVDIDFMKKIGVPINKIPVGVDPGDYITLGLTVRPFP